MHQDFGDSHVRFIAAQSEQTRQVLLARPFGAEQRQRYALLASASLAEQARIEAADTLDFESYRRQYLAPESLLA